jgi:sec-independent protein translocase protein TatA
MGISFANLILILLIVLVFFGAGKLPSVMGDLGKGIRNFRKELDENADNEKTDKEKKKKLPKK